MLKRERKLHNKMKRGVFNNWITAVYESGKGFRIISKNLKPVVWRTVNKWRTFKTTANTPKSASQAVQP